MVPLPIAEIVALLPLQMVTFDDIFTVGGVHRELTVFWEKLNPTGNRKRINKNGFMKLNL